MEILNPLFLRYYWIVESNFWVLFLCHWLGVGLLLIKLPRGERDLLGIALSGLNVLLGCTGGFERCSTWLQKCFGSISSYTQALPLTLTFISLLCFRLTFLCAVTLSPLLPERLALFSTFPMRCLFLFKTRGTAMLLWMWNKSSTLSLHLSPFGDILSLIPSFPRLLCPWLWSAVEGDFIKRRREGERTQQ